MELGPLELDIERRVKVHALMLWLQDNPAAGLRELTPGIRSLQVHYDSQLLTASELIAHIEQGVATIKDITGRRLFLQYDNVDHNDKGTQIAN